MRPKKRKYFFTVGQTFSEVTPESAELGDWSDHGWEREPSKEWTIAEILREIKNQGVEHISDNGSSLDVYGHFYTSCYRTGTDRQECLHIGGAPRNIRRLLKFLKKGAT